MNLLFNNLPVIFGFNRTRRNTHAIKGNECIIASI